MALVKFDEDGSCVINADQDDEITVTKTETFVAVYVNYVFMGGFAIESGQK